MTHHVTISVKIEREQNGKRRQMWERSVSEANALPSELLLHELLTVAANQLHPPKKPHEKRHD